MTDGIPPHKEREDLVQIKKSLEAGDWRSARRGMTRHVHRQPELKQDGWTVNTRPLTTDCALAWADAEGVLLEMAQNGDKAWIATALVPTMECHIGETKNKSLPIAICLAVCQALLNAMPKNANRNCAPLCAECEKTPAGHRDPRTPPLKVGNKVLCYACFFVAASERIETLRDEIADLVAEPRN